MVKRGRPPLKLSPEERRARRRTQFADSQRKARASKKRSQSNGDAEFIQNVIKLKWCSIRTPETSPPGVTVSLLQQYLVNSCQPHQAVDAAIHTALSDDEISPLSPRYGSELLDIAVERTAMSGFSPASNTPFTQILSTDAHSLPLFRSETFPECHEWPLFDGAPLFEKGMDRFATEHVLNSGTIGETVCGMEIDNIFPFGAGQSPFDTSAHMDSARHGETGIDPLPSIMSEYSCEGGISWLSDTLDVPSLFCDEPWHSPCPKDVTRHNTTSPRSEYPESGEPMWIKPLVLDDQSWA